MIAEPMREEHRHLWPHVEELRTVARALDDWSPEVPDRMRAATAYLHDHLLAHLRAEEAVLYPAYEEVASSPRAAATMIADHVEIERRIAALDAVVTLVADDVPPSEIASLLRDALYSLAAIIALHFVKEEQIILPFLDEKLDRAEADRILERMAGEATHV
jgi:iron-sulfur cluster repair protein YtfE (RIC family)